MLACTGPTTSARTAQFFAAAFWRERAAASRSIAAEGLQSLPDATALARGALLPPPPSPFASGNSPEASPAATALVAALRTPATAPEAACILMDAVSELLATALICKQDLIAPSAAGARTLGQHLLVVVGTLAAAAQWLRVLQHSMQQAPMLRLARLLLETLTVPRSSSVDDSARHQPGRSSAGSHSALNLHHSPISLFLQGAHFHLSLQFWLRLSPMVTPVHASPTLLSPCTQAWR
jgi:hypothetical protein